jgi:hypothetical protein
MRAYCIQCPLPLFNCLRGCNQARSVGCGHGIGCRVAAITISEASRASGISRTSIYRALRDGRLARFEVLQGMRRLLHPDAVPYLRSGAIRPRADSPWFGAPTPASAPPVEPVAADSGEGWLDDPAERTDNLRECWGDGDDWESFAREWAAWRPDETLSDRRFWEHCAEFVKGWMADPPPPVDALTVVSWYRACTDAVEAVAAGCRWDGDQWAKRAAELDAEFGVTAQQ